MPLRARPTAFVLTMAMTVLVSGCLAAGSSASNSLPGQVAPSRPPFDVSTATARYVDRCMKDGGTQGRCECEAADITSRLGNDGLERIVSGLAGGPDAAQAANKERLPSMTACGWPNTKL